MDVKSSRKAYDCAPTLTDRQVLDFCKNGYLMLEAVVPDSVNRKATAYCDENPGKEPTGILDQDWFFEHVVLNREAAGAVRSLLGRDFHLPILMSNHRREAPFSVMAGWHVDGNHQFSLTLHYLQVFYYPQDTPLELGPTEVLPGSHLVHNKAGFMGHLGSIRGALPTAAPAGSIFLTVYHIWHRPGRATGTGIRDLLKYNYWRTTAPVRDWIIEDDFDFATADYSSPAGALLEQFRANCKVAEMFLWLCGRHDLFKNIGGQSWPLTANRNDVPFGFPQGLARE